MNQKKRGKNPFDEVSRRFMESGNDWDKVEEYAEELKNPKTKTRIGTEPISPFDEVSRRLMESGDWNKVEEYAEELRKKKLQEKRR